MAIRAFFAVELEQKELINQIIKVQKELDLPDTAIKFVAPENLHLTMKFLGDINENIIPELQKAAEKISFKTFDLEISGMGCLPSYSYINAIYIGITKGFDELKEVAQKIDSLSSKFNFKKEDRPFKAHLTIGRLKKTGNKNLLVEKIKALEKKDFGTIKIDKFVLKKSDLTPTGPIYTTLFEVHSST
ncbi:MAG TPA: RNA 2',3'-cyclic phosphodiesterase [Candidatus Bathyarchaeia archaeon]|nr:RNA 2',3'-cyclic phosphodiesterase [Candidatus Bathyarchaeia archaeon]